VTDEPLAELLRRAAGGDQSAFADIVRITQADVAHTCSTLVDASAADDLVQDTYLRAFRALSSFRGESSGRTWLLAIARRVCVDEIRRRTRRKKLFRSLPPSPVALTHSGASELHMLLDALPAERREAFALTQLVGLTYAETAAVCGCEIGTVRSRVARARAELIAQLDADAQLGSA
jgi:RNA polymerase sigma-70 factor (ECF subfamily)